MQQFGGVGGICWEIIQRYSAQIVRIGWVRIRFEHFLKAMCLGDQNHNYIANIETSHYVIIIIILITINPIHAGVFLVLLFKIHVAPRKNFIRWNFF